MLAVTRPPRRAQPGRELEKDRYGRGAWGDPDGSSLLGPDSPWPADRAAALATHPATRVPEWGWDAAHAYVEYCVQNFGQYPVTFDPMIAGFGTVVHHVDTDYYERVLRPGYVTPALAQHDEVWHG